MSKLVAVVGVVVLVVVGGSTASAHEGHGSCGPWGSEVVAAVAQDLRPLGQVVSMFAKLGLQGENTATFHALFCDPQP